MHTHSKYPSRRNLVRPGFTLVELLTVIAVIILLIGILVPAVNSVRTTARNAAASSTIGTVATALEAFRADGQVGGQYPPSYSDIDKATGGVKKGFVKSPYDGISDFEITGAGLLVWALAGADLQGTPGFQPFKSASNYWGTDTGTDPGEAYELVKQGSSVRTAQTRKGPYVDLAKMNVTGKLGDAFPVEAEVNARQSLSSPNIVRKYPMFLDPFGFPILYWRADPAGLIGAGNRGGSGGGAPGAPGTRNTDPPVYNWAHNEDLLQGNNALVLRATKEKHALSWSKGTATGAPGGGAIEKRNKFETYIRNFDVPVPEPLPTFLPPKAVHRPDAYLLVSPGADGIYGTADDIANFPHNGGKMGS